MCRQYLSSYPLCLFYFLCCLYFPCFPYPSCQPRPSISVFFYSLSLFPLLFLLLFLLLFPIFLFLFRFASVFPLFAFPLSSLLIPVPAANRELQVIWSQKQLFSYSLNPLCINYPECQNILL